MTDDTHEPYVMEGDDPEPTRALVPVGPPVEALSLKIDRAPSEVLAEAQTAARALLGVINAKPKKVVFNGEQYLEFEDWQTVARFYGLTVRTLRTQSIQLGETRGFEAFAEVVHLASGAVVSAADAMCLSDEPNWSRKPLFQLRSMAQTRACAKALRNALAWVVVLAGFRPTPAEELPEARTEARQSATSYGGPPPGHPAAAPTGSLLPEPDGEPRQNGAQPLQRGPAGEFWIGQQGQVKVTHVERKSGTAKSGKPWTLFIVHFGKLSASTFDLKMGEEAEALMARQVPAEAELRPDEKKPDRYNLVQIRESMPL